jgi:hypothetical protein
MPSVSNRAALVLVLVFAAGLALLLILPAWLDRSGTPEGVAAALDGNPEIRQTIAALRAHYPADHRRLTERLAARARAGADQPALDREAAAFMEIFMAGKTRAIAAAPAAERRAVALAYADLIERLAARDPALCARFVTGTMPPRARPPRVIAARLDGIAAVRIRAARAGERAGGRPVRLDRRALFDRVEQSDPALAERLSRGTIAQATPAEQCRAALLLYRATAAATD